MFEYQLEHILSYKVTVAAPEPIGPLAEGLRLNFYFTGGEVTGPKVVGKVRRGGGDWLTIRRDGIGILEVRGTMETQEGALIYVTLDGTADFGEDGYEQILQGKAPSSVPLRTSPRFHTTHPQYVWLNRLHCLGIGQAYLQRFEVAYDVYAVR
jgi:hypothetical protein